MADIVLFGATGYTGRLTAAALARRGARVALAGRDRRRLDDMAGVLGIPDVRIADAASATSIRAALADARVLVTCVGPFMELGWPAVEAAIDAGVHYVDSTGEGAFIGRLIERFDAEARAAGIVMAPAFGFDETVADLACALAATGLDRPELTVTLAASATPSAGTARTVPAILATPGPFIDDGRTVWVRAGERTRWAPMPAPLGPRPTVSMPLAELRLAPLHLDLSALATYTTMDPRLRRILPALRAAMEVAPLRRGVQAVAGRIRGPDERARRKRFTVLVEARSGTARRTVAVAGSDVYGLTAETLAAGAVALAGRTNGDAGVVAPTQALGIEQLQKELLGHGVTIQTH